jgi:hypothetical protein
MADEAICLHCGGMIAWEIDADEGIEVTKDAVATQRGMVHLLCWNAFCAARAAGWR